MGEEGKNKEQGFNGNWKEYWVEFTIYVANFPATVQRRCLQPHEK